MNKPATSYTRCYCGKDDCEKKKDPLYANSEVDCGGLRDRKDMWFTIRFFIVVSILIFTLFGCSAGGGDEYTSCNTTYTYDYDVVGETGLTLRAMGDEYSFLSFEQMEAEYIDLEVCAANTNTPGPYVEFVDFREVWPRYSRALYYYAIMTAYIDTNNGEPPLERNCIADREFLRHEYMHHVLYLNGEDPSHANPKFAACDALGPKTCNGEYCE